MVLKKIKIIFFSLLTGILVVLCYFVLTESRLDIIEKKRQKTQEKVAEMNNPATEERSIPSPLRILSAGNAPTSNKLLESITPAKINIAELPKSIYNVKKMILIPGGTFLMGDENSNFPDERPVHFVQVNSFYMDETPVTYEDFKKYVEAGGTKSKYWEYETYNHPENPVTGIDWYHAVDYCNWRNKIEGLLGSLGYHLPTEAEFEYAARGGLEGKKFPWGDNFNSSLANFDEEKGIMKGDWWRLTKVKDTPPNNYGIYGMSGNVWQWTNDWYDENYYEISPKNNPAGPDAGRTKVLRGGSWGSISPDYLRTAKRSYTAPSNYNYDIGFRCARVIAEAILENPKIDEKAQYQFYQYQTISENKPLEDVYGKDFLNRLSTYIADNYLNSIYFQTKIDEQEIITPKQMAQLIIETTKNYNINPLFLTGIMAAESGFGCCSFPRWYNNPMAYHWQNALMKNGLPTYKPTSRNRKYIDLKTGFREFAKGIKRDIYLNAAKKDLDAFHLLYVGYRADEWMYTLAKVYNDVLGIKLEPHLPVNNIGEYIYTDWNKPKTLIPNLPNNDLEIVDKIISWSHHTPSQKRTIDAIIIHSAYDALGDDVYSVDGVLYEFKLYSAGTHYLIGRDGVIYRLVPEEDVAYHAGTSKMPDGRTNINDFSIGIELIYHEDETPNEIQYQKLVDLVKTFKLKYKINYILGHKDIVPSRKTDPWNFDWQKFNEMLKK